MSRDRLTILPAGERRRWALGPLAALLVVVGVCTSAAVPGPVRGALTSAAAPVSGGVTDPVAAARLTDVRGLLARRAAALRRHDRTGWLAGIDPAATRLRTKQATMLTDIAQVPLSTWSYAVGPGDEQGRLEADGSWTVRVTLSYALRDADRVPTERPLVLTFAERSGHWLIAADDRPAPDGATRTWRGPWEHGPLLVRRGPHSLVLAHPSNGPRLESFGEVVDAVVPRVRALVGAGTPDVVAVLIPDDQAEMSEIIGERLVLGKIAAVSVADEVDTARGRAEGQRIVVNPTNIDRLGTVGRKVVLQHEVTHLATRGSTGPDTPIWLVEGLADWVGYSDSGLGPGQVGDELVKALRGGHWPGRLPEPADFRGDSPRLALAYEEAWSACRLIADRAGPAALLHLYRVVGTSADPATVLDQQLRRTVGLDLPHFTAEWRASVRAEFG